MRLPIRLKPEVVVPILILGFTPFWAGNSQAHTRLSDAMIQAMVMHRLEHQKVLRDKNIQVSVEDGVVSMKGNVESIAERKRAEKAALGVNDVSAVQNILDIAANRSDQQIATDLSKDIRSFVFYNIFDWIEGSVHQGNVTLSGYVYQTWRKEDYERMAEEISGAKSVSNQIEILPTSAFDDQLRIATARLIYGDPQFIRYAHQALPPIHIVVDNGNVILKGSVANPLERQEIESMVRTGVLAFNVVDDLGVDQG